MDIQIENTKLRGCVRAVASKSCAHRLLILAALADAPCRVEIGELSEDIYATARCLRALGARIEAIPGGYQVGPVDWDRPRRAEMDCGESGSTLRFLLPLAARLPQGSVACFRGGGRLPERPNTALTEAMRLHGATVSADYLPIEVSGPLKSGEYVLPGNVSSQFVTGLLMTLPALEGDSSIRFTTPVESAGYIDMTVSALNAFHVRVAQRSDGYDIPGGQIFHSPGVAYAEGDWSNAAFFLAARALGSEVRVDGLNGDSVQGDRAIAEILRRMSAPDGSLTAQRVDASGIPDLVPILAVVATQAAGVTEFVHAGRLRIKECDRLNAMRVCLNALGGEVEEKEDGLLVRGGRPLSGGEVDSFGDHRIVMSMAIAATVASGPVVIRRAEAVAKSYPAFFEDFQALGGRVTRL